MFGNFIYNSLSVSAKVFFGQQSDWKKYQIQKNTKYQIPKKLGNTKWDAIVVTASG